MGSFAGAEGGEAPKQESATVVLTEGAGTRTRALFSLAQAMKAFLGIPLLLLLGFLGISLILYSWDRATPEWIRPLRTSLNTYFFRSTDVTAGILDTVAGGLITQTSIVISMLLLTLQQVAGTMGNLIYDQFFHRYRNQVYLGVVLGSIVLALTLRAGVSDEVNPVLGATAALLTMFTSLGLLVWFVFSAIHQMRPKTIVEEIHDETDRARERHLQMLDRTRRRSESRAEIAAVLRSEHHGYVINIDLDKIQDCLEGHGADVEIVSGIQVGDYVSYYGHLADIKADDPAAAEEVASCIGRAYRFDQKLSAEKDARYGLQQFEAIAWTEGSTSKQNPETVLIVLRTLKNLMMRWTLIEYKAQSDKPSVPLVYNGSLLAAGIEVLESLAIISSESMQHQNFARIIEVTDHIYPYLPKECQKRCNEMMRRIMSAMGDHVLSRELDNSLSVIETRLKDAGHSEVATDVEQAHQELARSVGELANRSTRVKAGSN